MTEPSGVVVPPPTGTVFISDDDDDLDETLDEWVDGVAGSTDQHPYLIHAGHIQHQLNLCYGLLCLLPVLVALVVVSWRRYGGIITATHSKDGEGASRSRSTSVDKKNT